MAKKLSDLSRRGKLQQVRSSATMLNDKMRAELHALKKRPIDLSDHDAPEIIHWKGAVRGKFYRPIEEL